MEFDKLETYRMKYEQLETVIGVEIYSIFADGEKRELRIRPKY